MREIANQLKANKNFSQNHLFALFGYKDEKLSVIIALSDDLLSKFDASKLITPIVEAIGGKGGGGKKDMAMGGGTNKEGISRALNILKNKFHN